MTPTLAQAKWGQRIFLQGRTSAQPQFGTYSTALIEQAGPTDTLEKAFARAMATIESARNRWIENFDHSIEFRVTLSAFGE